MNFQEILARYYYFHSNLMSLGSFSLNEKPKLDNLTLSRGSVQAAYKLIRKLNFKISLIDYLCLISLQFVQYNWLLGATIISERKTDPLITFNNKEEKLIFYLVELAESCLRFREDAKNMLRLTFNNPHYFFESAGYQEFRSKFQEYSKAALDVLCFQVISKMYYYYSFRQDDFTVADFIRKELKNLEEQKISPSQETVAEKILAKLLPREKKVLRGIVEYLKEVGGNQIISAEKTLVKHFSMQKVKISHSTIYKAVQGLTKIGLLKRLPVKKWRAFVFKFNKKLYEDYEASDLKI